MKPAQFEYEAPTTVEETLELLAQYGDECKVLAGGQSLVPLMNFRLARPARLIDINGVAELSYIKRQDGRLVVGATTRHSTLERSAEVAEQAPLLSEAVRWVGHSQIRNRGTVGGSLAHADPAAELSAAFAALDGGFHIASRRGRRTVSWQDFFVAEFTTTIEPDELLVAVEAPIPAPGTGSAFVEFARRHGDFALGGAAVTLQVDAGGRCTKAAIVLLAAGSKPVRPEAAEQSLVGAAPDAAAIQEAARAAVKGVHPTADIHGSTEYRVGLLQAMTERALTKAASRARYQQ